MPRIHPFLWFDHEAEEAANFYVSIFPNSKVLSVMRNPPGALGREGEVMTVDFELDGFRVSALNGGLAFNFSEAVSFVIDCKDQAEVDYYWEKLIGGRDQAGQCGWLKDRFGLFLAGRAAAALCGPGRSRRRGPQTRHEGDVANDQARRRQAGSCLCGQALVVSAGPE